MASGTVLTIGTAAVARHFFLRVRIPVPILVPILVHIANLHKCEFPITFLFYLWKDGEREQAGNSYVRTTKIPGKTSFVKQTNGLVLTELLLPVRQLELSLRLCGLLLLLTLRVSSNNPNPPGEKFPPASFRFAAAPHWADACT